MGLCFYSLYTLCCMPLSNCQNLCGIQFPHLQNLGAANRATTTMVAITATTVSQGHREGLEKHSEEGLAKPEMKSLNLCHCHCFLQGIFFPGLREASPGDQCSGPLGSTGT